MPLNKKDDAYYPLPIVHMGTEIVNDSTGPLPEIDELDDDSDVPIDPDLLDLFGFDPSKEWS